MIKITGNEGFDIFIMQSDENRQKVLELMNNYELELYDALAALNLRPDDFTALDWADLKIKNRRFI